MNRNNAHLNNVSAHDSFRDLKRHIEEQEFRGYDPYDALNSPFLDLLSFNSKYLRIAFIQALKRLPFNLRPLLGIKKGYNPKALGLFLWGYAKLYTATGEPRCLEQIDRILDLLAGLKSPGCSGNAWGYNFDWQSRAFFVPKYTPTVVNSSFIGHALLDAWEMTGTKRALDMALPIADFILRDINRHKEDGAVCFSYTPLDRYFVHNANLLGASLLIRLFRQTGNERCRKVALAALTYSMKYQRKDGSWYYAEKKGAQWIDSFHTGFNLQAIRYFLAAGLAGEYRPAFERGVRFYCQNFFLQDGTPKYYHDRIYPIDIHSPAQAVVFFSGMGGAYQALTHGIMNWMLANMQDQAGYFYFQKHRYYTNRIPYIRWGQAWAFHALTEYLVNEKNGRAYKYN
ncbi:MAG: hypothetical protein R6T90_02415 [Dissulfuribacterales bacterium]